MGGYMSVKSILTIGNVGGYTGLICHMLMKGYRIFYTEEFKSGLSFMNQEGIGLVIIGNMAIDRNPLENPSLMNLIESDIPVILTRGNGFEGPIIEIFQDQCYFSKRMIQKNSLGSCPLRRFHGSIFGGNSKMQVVLRELVGRKDVGDTTECFFNGIQEEAVMSDHLTFWQEKNFISLELNGDGNAKKMRRGIERAIAFMEKHYDEDISLDQISHAAYLSTYHFCRLFKKQVGTTCNKYLSILRIEKAKELLKETELSVTEICFEVGFNYLTHFERVFKGLEGTTPSVYRQFC